MNTRCNLHYCSGEHTLGAGTQSTDNWSSTEHL